MIIYKDFSLRKRLETTPKQNTYAQDNFGKKSMRGKQKEEPEEKEHVPKLQCLEVDLDNPLTREEWNNFIAVIEETQGLGWF